MATVLDTIINDCLTEFNTTRATAFAMTTAQAATVSEAPGLPSDPVLGPVASLAALNLAWKFFFECNFEVTGHQKILMMQQSLDLNRAKGHVNRLRTRANVQDPVVFNLNQVS